MDTEKDELARLEEEVKKLLADNRRFLERFLDEELEVAEEEEEEAAEEEVFEEL